MRKLFFCLAMALGLAISVGNAGAADLKIGLTTHDLDVSGKDQSEETGPSLAVELVSEPLPLPDWMIDLRLYANATVNLQGHTNYGGVGLLWRGDFTPKWFAETSLGYVMHDGKTQIPDISPNNTPQENARLQRLDEEYIEFGSRDLFRGTFGIGYRFSDHRALLLHYEHLSHGQILGEGSNEALDAFGLNYMIQF